MPTRQGPRPSGPTNHLAAGALLDYLRSYWVSRKALRPGEAIQWTESDHASALKFVRAHGWTTCIHAATGFAIREPLFTELEVLERDWDAYAEVGRDIFATQGVELFDKLDGAEHRPPHQDFLLHPEVLRGRVSLDLFPRPEAPYIGERGGPPPDSPSGTQERIEGWKEICPEIQRQCGLAKEPSERTAERWLSDANIPVKKDRGRVSVARADLARFQPPANVALRTRRAD